MGHAFSHLDRRSPAVVGHRGAPRRARENTVEAFRAAQRDGADGVELDVRRSREDALVVHHDAVVDGFGPLVAASLDEIRSALPYIPTLDEALAACDGMWVNAEIKNTPGEPDWDPDERIARALVEWIARHDARGQILVSSFNPSAIAAVVERDPAIATGWLLPPGADLAAAIPGVAAGGHHAVHPHVSSLAGSGTRDGLALCADAGLRSVVWTVDAPEDVTRLAAAGASAIITNEPKRALDTLRPFRDGGG